MRPSGELKPIVKTIIKGNPSKEGLGLMKWDVYFADKYLNILLHINKTSVSGYGSTAQRHRFTPNCSFMN